VCPPVALTAGSRSAEWARWLALALVAVWGAGCVDLTPPDADARCRDATGCEGLELHWQFDDAEGETARDASGNQRAGSWVGANGTLPARSSEAAPVPFDNPASRRFQASNRQAVLLADMPAALRPSAELTLAAWYRATTLDPSTGVGEVISGGNNYLLRVRAEDVELSKRVTRNGGNQHVRCYAPASQHLDGAWHHLAAVVSATTLRVYVDGVEGCQEPNADPLAYDQSDDLWVGRHPTSDNYDFNGDIDEVRIYRRALDAAEVATLAVRVQATGRATPR
jgi:hypothetical protein